MRLCSAGLQAGCRVGLSAHAPCPQTQWANLTIQIEDGAVSLPDDVNVRRPVIVGVDYDAQTPQSQDGWQEYILS